MEEVKRTVIDWFRPTSTESTTTQEPIEELPQEEQEEATELENLEITEEVAELPTDTTEEVADTKTEDVVEQEEKKPLKVNPKDYIEANRDTLKKFLELESLDITSISQEDAVRRKLKSDYPMWSDKDIEDEMQDKYGIGKSLLEIDEDTMSYEEIEKIKKENEKIAKEISIGQRELKKDSVNAYKYLESLKESAVELPEWELNIDTENKEVFKGYNSPEELIESYVKDQEEQVNKVKNEYWIPTINKTVSEVEAITETIKTNIDGDEVVFDVSYELSESDKKELEDYLHSYNASEQEASLYIQNGKVDLQSFVKQKAKERLHKEITSLAVKEGVKRALAKFVKEGIVNYTPNTNSKAPHEEDLSPKGWFDRVKRTNRN